MGHALKRYLAAAALGAATLSLAACGSVTTEATPSDEASAEATGTTASSEENATESAVPADSSETSKGAAAGAEEDSSAKNKDAKPADDGACTGENITIDSAVDSPVNLTGDCGVITLAGQGIVLVVENAKGIVDKSGMNTVSGDAVGDVSVVGDASTFDVESVGVLRLEGNMNTVKTSAVKSVWVAGDGNTVSWEKPLSAAPETIGSANTLSGPR